VPPTAATDIMPAGPLRVFSSAAGLLSFLVMGFERLSYDRTHDGFAHTMRWRGGSRRTHRHSELEINLVLRGRGTYILDDRRYDLARDSLLWLFPAQNHLLAAATDDFSMIVAVFSKKLVKRVCMGPALPLAARDQRRSFCRRIASRQALRLRDLYGEVERAAGDAQRFNAGLAYALLCSWDAYVASSDILASGVLHPSVERAARLVVDGSADDRLAALALEVGLSPSRLSRLFAVQMGVSLVEFRNVRRLERFMGLHDRAPEANALSLALEAGFGSYAQFYRVFRRAMGYGPRELGSR
jgi:AraC-like DNA-binding protein